MADKYDEAIAYLTEHPDRICDAWSFDDEGGSALFQYCDDPHSDKQFVCGCLTQVAHNNMRAATPALTRAIRRDKRIPQADEITVDDLPVFAEWQRRLDRELPPLPARRKYQCAKDATYTFGIVCPLDEAPSVCLDLLRRGVRPWADPRRRRTA